MTITGRRTQATTRPRSILEASGRSLTRRPSRRIGLAAVLVLFGGLLVVGVGVSPAAAAPITISGTMEGALQFGPGSWVSGGYHFKSEGTAPVTFVGAQVAVPVACSKGGAAVGFIVVPLENGPYTPDGTNWTPWKDQSSTNPLPYQGSVQAPDLCAGGSMFSSSVQGPASFAADALSTSSGKVDIQFHYRVPAGKGKGNVNCFGDPTADPRILKADVCQASMSPTGHLNPTPPTPFQCPADTTWTDLNNDGLMSADECSSDNS